VRLDLLGHVDARGLCRGFSNACNVDGRSCELISPACLVIAAIDWCWRNAGSWHRCFGASTRRTASALQRVGSGVVEACDTVLLGVRESLAMRVGLPNCCSPRRSGRADEPVWARVRTMVLDATVMAAGADAAAA